MNVWIDVYRIGRGRENIIFINSNMFNDTKRNLVLLLDLDAYVESTNCEVKLMLKARYFSVILRLEN